ncbi:MAG: O-antigen polymerase [Candidatus Falkowbacteria bacterium]
MKEFLGKIFKKKRIILGIILFFVITSAFFVFYNLNSVNAQTSPYEGNSLYGGRSAILQEYDKNELPEVPFSERKNSQSPSTLMIWITTALGWVLAGVSKFVGYFLSLILQVLINVASFNNIIDVDAVKVGWVIARDLYNMFFVLILLVIAFATILRIESYSAQKLLPKLIIFAILINFSRTIFGLIIDFSQVIMMTFVNSFAGAPGELVSFFQMDKYFSLKDVEAAAYQSNSALAVLAGMIGGFIALLITTVVVVILLGVLLMRVIMLWVYTILSPFVFLGHAFPAAAKYTQQIWSDFIKNVISGPLLAFFIWLALTTAATSSATLNNSSFGASRRISPSEEWGLEISQEKKYEEVESLMNNDAYTNSGDMAYDSYSAYKTAYDNRKSSYEEKAKKNKESAENEITVFSAIYNEKDFQTYIITIALLIGGLMVTQQMGGMAGSLAGKGIGAIKSGAWKYSGGRRVSDTWKAFQGQREEGRKTKVAATGAKLYGAYTGAKGLGSGVLKAGEKVIDRAAGKKAGAVKAGIGAGATIAAVMSGGAIPAAILTSIMAMKGAKFLSSLGGKASSAFKAKEDEKRDKFDAASSGEKSDNLDKDGNAVAETDVNSETYQHQQNSGMYITKDVLDELKKLNLNVSQARSAKYDKDNDKWNLYDDKGVEVNTAGGIDGKSVLADKEGDMVEKHGRLKNSKGEFKYDETSNDYYKVNKKGEAIDDKGDVVIKASERVSAKVGGKLKGKIGEVMQEMTKGWVEGRSKAWALQSKANNEKTTKAQAEMTEAGISPEMMRSILMDDNSDKDKRVASALTLAIKDGFSGVDIKQAKVEVSAAKELIGSNKLTEKEFNEGINKRFAHLNYDTSTEAGREQMKDAAADGSVDLTKQDASAYDTNMVRVMKDYYGKEFIPKLNDTAKINTKNRGNIEDALEEIVKTKNEKPVDKDGKLDVNRIALANLTGDLFKSMSVIDKDGKQVFNEDSEEGLTNLIENAKVEHLAKIDVDLLDKSAVKKVAVKYGIDEIEAEGLIGQVRNIIGKSLSKNQLTGLEKSRDATQKLKTLVDEAAKEAKSEEDFGNKGNEGSGI